MASNSKTKIVALSGAPTMTQKVTRADAWREQYNPLRGLTLQAAASLSDGYFRGDMADYQWACSFIEQTDSDLFALVSVRLSRLEELNYHFTPEKGADPKMVERQTALLTEKFALITNLMEAVEHLALAPFRGFAHCEKWYENGELVRLEPVDQWNVVRDGLRGKWRYNPKAERTTYAVLGAAADMPAENFLYREVRRHINRIALFKFIRGNFSEKDWDAFIEIYGIPGGILIGPPDLQAGKEAEFRNAAENIAQGGTGYAPHGSEWKPNDIARDNNPYKERLNHLSEKLVLAGTGGKLTMLTESGSGTLASGAHSDVFDQIVAAEAVRIAECINKQIVGPMLAAAFPHEPCVVYFVLASNAPKNTRGAVDQVLMLAESGFSCDPQEVSERTGWTVTPKAVETSQNLSPLMLANQFRGRRNAPLLKNRAAEPVKGDWYRLLVKGEEVIDALKLVRVVDEISIASISRRFKAESAKPNFPGVLVDTDYFSLSLDTPTGAVGWVKELRQIEGALEARIEWTDSGQAWIDGRSYKYLSPVYNSLSSEKLGTRTIEKNTFLVARMLELDRVALTNSQREHGGNLVLIRNGVASEPSKT